MTHNSQYIEIAIERNMDVNVHVFVCIYGYRCLYVCVDVYRHSPALSTKIAWEQRHPDSNTHPNTHVLVSKCHALLKPTKDPGERADFKARAGKVWDETGTFGCPGKKLKKCSSNKGNMSKVHRSQLKKLSLTPLRKFKQQYQSC